MAADYRTGGRERLLLGQASLRTGIALSPDGAVPPDVSTLVFGEIPVFSTGGPSLPSDFFKGATASPTVPVQPKPAAPKFDFAGPSGIPPLLVFPSEGVVPPPITRAASWFDQEMIPGVKNLFLAIGGLGLLAVVALKPSKRKRR